MKADQERVQLLLTDTITLLCSNGLSFQKSLRVQGLLGITLDEQDVFIVHINENLAGGLNSDLSVESESPHVGKRSSTSTEPVPLQRRKCLAPLSSVSLDDEQVLIDSHHISQSLFENIDLATEKKSMTMHTIEIKSEQESDDQCEETADGLKKATTVSPKASKKYSVRRSRETSTIDLDLSVNATHSELAPARCQNQATTNTINSPSVKTNAVSLKTDGQDTFSEDDQFGSSENGYSMETDYNDSSHRWNQAELEPGFRNYSELSQNCHMVDVAECDTMSDELLGHERLESGCDRMTHRMALARVHGVSMLTNLVLKVHFK